MTIREICDSFKVGGKYIGCEKLSTGIINQTYKVNYIRDGEDKHYIVQQINKSVFKNPEKVMDNIVRVTDYIRENVKKNDLSTKKYVVRVFMCDGKPYVVDENGEYWRCYRFIPNSTTYDITEDVSIIKSAGMAFGRFQNFLAGFDADSLYISIPDFHNTIKRYEAFKKAIKEDVKGRANSVKQEIDTLLSFEEKATRLQKMLDNKEIPLRVTHNDTKCNNVCFDNDTKDALAVLDLDTVMPGAVAYDFGDAIRFIANKVEEDCPDVSKVSLDLVKYQAFAVGFVDEIAHTLTEKELETLNLGLFTMTCELAVRFLTDYLNGDVYFITKYPGHNLDRARNQIALTVDINKKEDVLQQILKNELQKGK